MKLLANENFPLDSVNFLKNQGIDVVAIGVDHQGVADRTVLNMAIEEERTILTFDRDYGELIFKFGLKPPKGVIYLRIDQFESEEPGKIVSTLLADVTFTPDARLTVVTRETVRQRKY